MKKIRPRALSGAPADRARHRHRHRPRVVSVGSIGALSALTVVGVGSFASPAFADIPSFGVSFSSVTPIGSTPLVPGDTPAPDNEVQTYLVLRVPNAQTANATNISFDTTLPAGAVFASPPTVQYQGGAPNTIGNCTTTLTSFDCTGGFLGALGDNIVLTFIVSLTSSYTATSFTQPFGPVTFDDPDPGSFDITGLPATAVTPGVTPPSGPVINIIAGAGTNKQFTGPADEVSLDEIQGMAVDGAGNLYVDNTEDDQVGEVETPVQETPGFFTRTAKPVADVGQDGTLDDDTGNPTNLGDGGPALQATLNQPSAVAVDSKGDVFIADTENNLIREVTTGGVIHTVAGTGQAGYLGDGGPATAAELDNPSGVAVDAAGDLFIADSDNNVIREVNPAGTITTIAGHPTTGPLAGEGGPFDDNTGLGGGGFGGDGGPASQSLLEGPQGISVDAAGDLFVADTGNSVIREITAAGTINTVAGEGDQFNYSGDGGPASQAQLDAPYDVAVDAAGDLFIADTFNNAIREVDPTGTITTIAGGHGVGNSGLGGVATAAQLDTPESVAVDSATGDVYLSSLAGYTDEITGLPATSTAPTVVPEAPLAAALPLGAGAIAGGFWLARRRRARRAAAND